MKKVCSLVVLKSVKYKKHTKMVQASSSESELGVSICLSQYVLFVTMF